MSLVLFWHPSSQPSRALKATAVAAGALHEEKIIDFFNGEHKSPEFLKICPAGQVPALTYNGKALS